MEILFKRLEKAFSLTHDLVTNLKDEDLELRLSGLPSNKIKGQLYCLLGARESYARALKAGSWQGFSCTLDKNSKRGEFLKAFEESALNILRMDKGSLNEEILFELLEHEVQHHGQLIRYIYGNKLDFPKSWNERYTV